MTKELKDQVRLLTMELERIRSADPALTQALDDKNKILLSNGVFRKLFTTLKNAKEIIGKISTQENAAVG